MALSIWCVIFFASGFLVSGFLFRRHYKRYASLYREQQLAFDEQKHQLEIRKEALREIMRRTHHEDINPVAKRIRGLSKLGLLGSARTMNLFDLLSKPDHLDYSTSGMIEVTQIIDYFKKIEREALSLENATLDKVKEFEHLQ